MARVRPLVLLSQRPKPTHRKPSDATPQGGEEGSSSRQQCEVRADSSGYRG